MDCMTLHFDWLKLPVIQTEQVIFRAVCIHVDVRISRLVTGSKQIVRPVRQAVAIYHQTQSL